MSSKKMSVLISAALLLAGAGCSKPYFDNPNERNAGGQATYVSEKLGIQFTYPKEIQGRLTEQGNVIRDPQGGDNGYIMVFDKSEDETIDSALLRLVSETDRDSSKCKVVKKEEHIYIIDLVDSNFAYTEDEQRLIKKMIEDQKKDSNQYGEDFAKDVIYNQRLVSACSTYAHPKWPATSKVTDSIFLYDETKSKTTFVYFPASTDPLFFDANSIEFIK